MLRSKSSRSGNVDVGQNNHPSSVLSRTFSASKFCRGDALVSQINSNALKSVERKSVDRYPSKASNLTENPTNKVLTMQEQMGKVEDELKRTKEQLNVAEEERNRALSELREAKRVAYEVNMKVSNDAFSPRKTGELMTEIKNLKELLCNSKQELKMNDEKIESLKLELQQAKRFEVKLAEKDASLIRWKEEFDKVNASEAYALDLLSGSKKRIEELEDEVQRGNVSEAKMLDSLASQTKQLEQIKIELEESKLEIAAMKDRIMSFEASSKQSNSVNIRPDEKEEKEIIIGETESIRSDKKLAKEDLDENVALSKSKSSLDEIGLLKTELKLAIEAEEKSKKAMDDLALALKEVATESNQAKEKHTATQLELEQVRGEAEQLKMMVRSTEERYEKIHEESKKEIELHKNTADRLRVEAEETLLAWNGKEMGFVTCIKRAEEERAVAQHETSRLAESLKAAEHKARTARDESSKLRDILKQAINESNAAKAAAGLARDENSHLKDCLAEKDEALYFLTQENERLRINEVAAHENIKELKRLLSIASTEHKAENNKNEDWILRSQSLNVEEHEEKKNKLVRKNFSFNLKELKFSNDGEESDEALSHDDPKKAEALKGSIFDPSTETPRSDLQTPKSVPHHWRESSAFTDDGKTPTSEDFDHLDNGSFDDSDSDRNYRRRKTMFRRVGDLIMRKSFHKREASTE